MAFVKTTWVANGPPGITAAQLNRMEAGIADSFGAVQTITAATGFSFTGLDGENDYAYDFTFVGKCVGAMTVDHGLILRPNNDSSGANYATSSYWRWYQDPAGTFTSGGGIGQSGATGIELGQCNWFTPMALIIHSRILTASGQKRVASSTSTGGRSDADARKMRLEQYGHWADQITAINRLDFAWVQMQPNMPAPQAGCSITGRAILRRLTM